jgi:arginine exporter protein ArgO
VIAALVAGFLAGYGIAMPVGAVGAYLVSLTARTSFTIGACAALGVATADGLYALIAMAGGSVLTPLIEPVMVPLRWVSGAVLIALAARGGTSAIRQYRERRRSAAPADETPMGPARAYWGLLAITMLNPMTVIYFAALVVGGQTTGQEPTLPEQAVFVLAAFAASASWQLLVAGGGALLGRALTGVRGRLVTAIASSALIAVLAVHLLVSS